MQTRVNSFVCALSCCGSDAHDVNLGETQVLMQVELSWSLHFIPRVTSVVLNLLYRVCWGMKALVCLYALRKTRPLACSL